jgi:hypothetical protein
MAGKRLRRPASFKAFLVHFAAGFKLVASLVLLSQAPITPFPALVFTTTLNTAVLPRPQICQAGRPDNSLKPRMVLLTSRYVVSRQHDSYPVAILSIRGGAFERGW